MKQPIKWVVREGDEENFAAAIGEYVRLLKSENRFRVLDREKYLDFKDAVFEIRSVLDEDGDDSITFSVVDSDVLGNAYVTVKTSLLYLVGEEVNITFPGVLEKCSAFSIIPLNDGVEISFTFPIWKTISRRTK